MSQIALTIGASNSSNLKRQKDTAMCFKGIPRMNPRMNHWQAGATT